MPVRALVLQAGIALCKATQPGQIGRAAEDDRAEAGAGVAQRWLWERARRLLRGDRCPPLPPWPERDRTGMRHLILQEGAAGVMRRDVQ